LFEPGFLVCDDLINFLDNELVLRGKSVTNLLFGNVFDQGGKVYLFGLAGDEVRV